MSEEERNYWDFVAGSSGTLGEALGWAIALFVVYYLWYFFR